MQRKNEEKKMGRIIAIANQKGGVGKTTTSINLSACLAEAGKKVLTVDIDPQGNTTSGLGVDKTEERNTIYQVVIDECTIEEAIIKNIYENLDLVASDVNLAGAEIDLIGIDEREYILKKQLEKVKNNYDFIIASPCGVGWLSPFFERNSVCLVSYRDMRNISFKSNTHR